ncbi:hypothetical protein [Streptomyces hawaiiensis]|uniref:Uncharacterized protein n=1 Tax=Streptomyces hawaiiensis TaxID=67305 RepID=A0A6G5RE98_9ACTN|nr:hypothetical protein [Streptomyces hawaiiensis]QCD56131.1 hypothetical protein CEB94_15600 [Streptomyces hawaiiensis]
MGSLRVTVCTSVLAAVALAPAAYAADAGSVSATPATPAPGSDVTLRVTGCAQRTAVAASAAFVADARLTVSGAGELTGESRVRSTLAAGSYAVQVTCGATRRTGTLTVQDDEARRSGAVPAPVPGAGAGGQPPAPGKGGQPSAPGADEEAPLSHRPGAPASPIAPVRAGGGGAAALVAAEERGTGPGTAQGATGLVLAGVAAVVVALRGVRRGRGTD